MTVTVPWFEAPAAVAAPDAAAGEDSLEISEQATRCTRVPPMHLRPGQQLPMYPMDPPYEMEAGMPPVLIPLEVPADPADGDNSEAVTAYEEPSSQEQRLTPAIHYPLPAVQLPPPLQLPPPVQLGPPLLSLQDASRAQPLYQPPHQPGYQPGFQALSQQAPEASGPASLFQHQFVHAPASPSGHHGPTQHLAPTLQSDYHQLRAHTVHLHGQLPENTAAQISSPPAGGRRPAVMRALRAEAADNAQTVGGGRGERGRGGRGRGRGRSSSDRRVSLLFPTTCKSNFQYTVCMMWDSTPYVTLLTTRLYCTTLPLQYSLSCHCQPSVASRAALFTRLEYITAASNVV